MTDVLDRMAKVDLIAWIKQQCYRKLPKQSDVLYLQWDRRSKAVRAMSAKHMETGECFDAKGLDELIRKFSETTNADEREKLFEEIKPRKEAFQKWIDDGVAINKLSGKLSGLYEKYEEAKKVESDE